MRKFLKKRSSRIAMIVAALVTVALAAAGVANAVTSSGLVAHAAYACVDLSTHTAFQVLDSPSRACPAGTTSIVIGAQGAPGKDGTNGTNGVNGTNGLTGAIANGPYPGATKLTLGSNSTSEWAHDGTLQTSWVSCPSGYVATGGGFGPNGDLSTAPNANDGKVTIVSSAPDYVSADGTVNVALAKGTPPVANADDAFPPNGWAVQGYNNETADVIVRPWVICAPAQ